MTLIVSVHVPEGIVLASDSLTYVTQDDLTEGKTLLNTLKIMPFFDKFGIGFFGTTYIKNKPLPYYVRSFEKEWKDCARQPQYTEHAMIAVKDKIKDVLSESTNSLGNVRYQYCIHLVGFDNRIPVTRTCTISSEQDDCAPARRKGPGSVCTGRTEVIFPLRELYGSREEPTKHMPLYEFMSLREGIRYAEFLIRTTELHYQFSRQLPRVGGKIDVAIVTPFNGFEWIRHKPYFG